MSENNKTIEGEALIRALNKDLEILDDEAITDNVAVVAAAINNTLNSTPSPKAMRLGLEHLFNNEPLKKKIGSALDSIRKGIKGLEGEFRFGSILQNAHLDDYMVNRHDGHNYARRALPLGEQIPSVDALFDIFEHIKHDPSIESDPEREFNVKNKIYTEILSVFIIKHPRLFTAQPDDKNKKDKIDTFLKDGRLGEFGNLKRDVKYETIEQWLTMAA
jgi:hypothetical protein